jgi:hypothetical protein
VGVEVFVPGLWESSQETAIRTLKGHNETLETSTQAYDSDMGSQGVSQNFGCDDIGDRFIPPARHGWAVHTRGF